MTAKEELEKVACQIEYVDGAIRLGPEAIQFFLKLSKCQSKKKRAQYKAVKRALMCLIMKGAKEVARNESL